MTTTIPDSTVRAGTPVTPAQAAVPAPALEQHDDQGRLVLATFESATDVPRQPASRCWLVAIDGSANSMHALEQAFRLASELGVRTIDLIHVQPWLSVEAARAELVPRGWASSAAARDWLEQQGAGWRLHVCMGEPAMRIVERAHALSSRGIAIGARGLSATEGLLLGSVVQQVVARAHGAVLVVR